jgi:hypothetical protein
MDCTTLQHAKDELAERLTELGRRLDTEKEPEAMARLISQRKCDQAALAILRAVTAVHSH